MKINDWKKISAVFAAVMAGALCLRQDAVAQEDAEVRKFSVGPRGAYYMAKDADEGEWFPGLQARVRMSDDIGLAGSIDYMKHDLGYGTTVRTYPIQATLHGYLAPGGFMSPFILGGVGWYHTRVEGPFGFSDSSSRFGLHAGVGLEIAVNNSLYLDTTLRYVWVESVASKDLNALDKTYNDRGAMFTLGLNFMF